MTTSSNDGYDKLLDSSIPNNNDNNDEFAYNPEAYSADTDLEAPECGEYTKSLWSIRFILIYTFFLLVPSCSVRIARVVVCASLTFFALF